MHSEQLMDETFTYMQEENSSEERLTLAVTNFLIVDRVGLQENSE